MSTRSIFSPPIHCVRAWLFAISFCFVLSAIGSAQDVTRTFRKGPYLQWPGTDTMTIMWESPTNRPGVVRYGLKGALDKQYRLETPRELVGVSPYAVTNASAEGLLQVTQIFVTNRVFLYEITLKNLQPKSAYTYTAETDGARTTPRTFRTFAEHQRKVTFIAYGDSRTNPNIHEALASNFNRHSPDFILHTGDLAADGRRYNLWGREFFGPLAEVIDEVPIFPSIGNHEQDASNYLHYVHLPGNERWYSYEVGPVHLLALDFHFETDGHEQFTFARRDLLTAKAPWKIFFCIIRYSTSAATARVGGTRLTCPSFMRRRWTWSCRATRISTSGSDRSHQRIRRRTGPSCVSLQAEAVRLCTRPIPIRR